MDNPLAGIGVVELGTDPATAYAGKLFADLGAEVTQVKIDGESASRPGDPDALSLYLNMGKARLVLDGSTAPIRLRELLAASSALFVSNVTDLARCALDAASVVREFPHLIVSAVTPYGMEAVSDSPADDLTLQALGGISIGIGLPDRAPLKLPGNQSAFQAGLCAAIAAAGALFAHKGQMIDVAAADVWASFYSGVDVALAHFARHRKHRAGHRVSGQPYPRTIYRCKDGYFAVQCGESRHWQSFLRMIGREDLATHPLFANRFKANDEHGDACDALIEPWFIARTKQEILAGCLENRIPGAPVYDVAEVVAHRHLAARGYLRSASVGGRTVKLPGSPFGPTFGQAVTGEGADAAGGAALDSGLRRNDRRDVAHRAALDCGDDRNSSARRNDDRDPMRPLTGLRVVDFGWVWAGAVPGHILADMGAEVIKVESTSPLDYMRQGRPIVGTQKDPEQNPMFHNVNRGKLSLCLKLDHPDAAALLKDLVAKSDVVIENFSPGVMKKFGLAYADLKAVTPDLVMCSMSAVGQEGPLRGIRTYATMIASLAGLDSMVGYPGERVLGSQSSYADPNASLHATLAILAALWHREKTGEGAYIDLSQWEACVSALGEQFADYALTGRIARTCGTQHPWKAPHGNYPAAGEDQWIAISVANDRQWQGLGKALASPAWMSQPEFSTQEGRLANRDALDAHLAEETCKRDAGALSAALSAAGVPSAPLMDAPRLRTHPVFERRALFEMVEHPVLGNVPVYRLPWHMDGAPVPITRRAPLLGEHTQYILRHVLGYSAERITAQCDAGLFA